MLGMIVGAAIMFFGVIVGAAITTMAKPKEND